MAISQRVSNAISGIFKSRTPMIPAVTEAMVSTSLPRVPPRHGIIESCVLGLICVLPLLNDTVKAFLEACEAVIHSHLSDSSTAVQSTRDVASSNGMSSAVDPAQSFSETVAPGPSTPLNSVHSDGSRTPELFHSLRTMTGYSVASSIRGSDVGMQTPEDMSFRSAHENPDLFTKAAEPPSPAIHREDSCYLGYVTPLEDLDFVLPFSQAPESPSLPSSNDVHRLSLELSSSFKSASESLAVCGNGIVGPLLPHHDASPVERSSVRFGDEDFQLERRRRARSEGLIIDGEISYSFLGFLGEGSYGRVLHVRSSAGEDLAVKVFNKRKAARDPVQLDFLVLEKDIWERITMHCRSPFLAPLHTSFQDDANIYFVTKLYPQGLRPRMGDLRYELGTSDIVLYAAELLLAIEDLHRSFIIHRDIKPENIVISPSGHLCLIDYGMARLFSECRSYQEFQGCRAFSLCGTPGYVAPEMLREDCPEKGYTCSVDIWAFGIVLLELFIGDGIPYFNNSCNEIVEQAILEADIDLESVVFDLEGRDLLSKILVTDPFERLTIEEIKAHPFFSRVDWDMVRTRGYNPSYIPGYRGPRPFDHPLSFRSKHSQSRGDDASVIPEVYVCEEDIRFLCPKDLLRDPLHGTLSWACEDWIRHPDADVTSERSFHTGRGLSSLHL
ncbi:kinase-like protein [Gloeophyllum trabeum ATCC 11539]|uniref:cAMP-dependent protein kinase n=1 Tax=Gloeophyllum trabeum (strain ATCC 11539 / FP-39264 / Madison 617) TaxID=670483 RepID=S7PS97_GLOTA|nr:kinase-like protein [Gloeophyllum trabeum ATCC 11539]EPQ50686.1 kinase-like protein [Gloeophyllum trabeum ATCC 11539]